MKKDFILIGIDDRRHPHFTDEICSCISGGKVFSGGIRHYDIVQSLLPAEHEWISITVPLDEVFVRYQEVLAEGKGPIVVFASGDPLFFGFANTVMRKMPDALLTIHPSFNSLQLLAHRIPMRYDDMRVVSLTGRPWQGLDIALLQRASKIGVLTDRTHTPTAIATRLLEYGYADYIMYVGEHLGHPFQERVRRLTLQEAAGTVFECPNCLILHTDVSRPRFFGIPDAAFEHLNGRSKMITKMPIRLLTLQLLDLPRRQVFWDIGFCTGSISIEAKNQFPHLEVYAFEVRPECEELMHLNTHRLGTPGIHSFIQDFLQVDLKQLPAPDAVFIGGHGGQLKEFVRRVHQVLVSGGCLVFNSVSAESQEMFAEACREENLLLSSSHRIALDDFNPITILKATKI